MGEVKSVLYVALGLCCLGLVLNALGMDTTDWNIIHGHRSGPFSLDCLNDPLIQCSRDYNIVRSLLEIGEVCCTIAILLIGVHIFMVRKGNEKPLIPKVAWVFCFVAGMLVINGVGLWRGKFYPDTVHLGYGFCLSTAGGVVMLLGSSACIFIMNNNNYSNDYENI